MPRSLSCSVSLREKSPLGSNAATPSASPSAMTERSGRSTRSTAPGAVDSLFALAQTTLNVWYFQLFQSVSGPTLGTPDFHSYPFSNFSIRGLFMTSLGTWQPYLFSSSLKSKNLLLSLGFKRVQTLVPGLPKQETFPLLW